MPIATIDARDWFRGASTSDELSDGGFSPLSKGINLFARPGLLLPGPAPADTADAPDLAQGIFGWAAMATAGFFGRAAGVGNTNQGRFYLINAAGTIGATVTENTKVYTPNLSDMAHYGLNLYITSAQNITRTAEDFSSLDADWWGTTLGLTTLDTFSPHHMAQFGEILYIADKNMIHSWDGSTGTYNALDLPVGYVIDDLKAYNNLLYICASPSTRFNASVSAQCRIFTWDGFSDSFLDEFPIQERIHTLIPFGGTLFLTTEKYIGYFTGSTISPLYPLTSIVYKHQAAVTNDRLYLLQGADVLCYGNPIISKPKFFSFPIRHTSTLLALGCIQTGSLIYGYASKIGAFSSVDGSDQTGNIFYGNRTAFGRQVRIRAMIVESEVLASGSSMNVQYIDDTATARGTTPSTYDFATLGAVMKHLFKNFNKPATLTFQPKLTFTATPNKGVRRIHYWFEPSELEANS